MLIFLLTTWPIIIRADSSRAPQLAARDDQTEGSARALLVGASVASLLGAGYALHLAGQKSGAPRMLLISAAVLTVVLSWAVINTVYTLSRAGGWAHSAPPVTATRGPASVLRRLGRACPAKRAPGPPGKARIVSLPGGSRVRC